MKWIKYTIETITSAEDIVSAALSELGIEGVEIDNNVPLTEEETSGMFIDFPPELPPDDGTSRVSFYLEADKEQDGMLKQVLASLNEIKEYMDIGSGKITQSETEDVDWINNWKQFFTAFTINDILIKPTWEELKETDAQKILIEIDPGISFGTGKHETTQLCIRQLQKYIQAYSKDESNCQLEARKKSGPKVLDVGCGSGILSIAALKLGASAVTGIDIDENCIISAQDNIKVNHLEEMPAVFYSGNLLEDKGLQEKEGKGEYDIVVANILADVIIPMAPFLMPCLKSGGIFITSGIIDFKEAEVKQALTDAGFELLETNKQGEWVNLTVRKK